MAEPSTAEVSILHVTSERGWRGGERQVLLLMREIAPFEISQSLAAPAGSRLAECAADAGFSVTLLHPRATSHPVNLLRLLRLLKADPPPILHVHSSPALTLAAFARRLGRVRGIVYTRRTAFAVRRARKNRNAKPRWNGRKINMTRKIIAASFAHWRRACRSFQKRGGFAPTSCWRWPI